LLLLALAASAMSAATPALAQGGWGGAGWGGDRWGAPREAGPNADDAREGRVDVERFPAPDAAPLLGHGVIAVEGVSDPDAAAQAPARDPDAPPIASSIIHAPDLIDSREQAVYEAAVIDRLAKAGYDTASPSPTGGQLAELHVTHALLVPQEQKHSPVSGEMAMGVSNRGSMMGLGINIDLTKPKGALISTQLTLRIRDRASGRPLWEGRASIATREGDSHWSDQRIAARLAAALFAGFPTAGASR
jgi:hypothetical protein